MSGELNRRSFLKISAVAAITVASAGASHKYPGSPCAMTPPYRGMPLDLRVLPPYEVQADKGPALARRYPWIRYGEKPAGLVQIANIKTLPADLECAATSGILGERIITLASGPRLLPWAPMFRRPTRVYPADRALRPSKTVRLFVKDEGSEATPLFGNKIRKYEFLLPNLACSGIRTLRTYGAYGSNHCAYLTLAARYGRYRIGADPEGMEMELFLYPQDISLDVLTKLRMLVAGGARLGFLEGDVSVGLSILGEELRGRCSAQTAAAYVPPGGSSPLSVLGHVEAMMELAEQIEAGDCPLAVPPDFIFVPLGSGATAMGLVLGCYLLGWPTTVVGTCSQDKGRLARLVVNGDVNTPFLMANAASLLEKSLQWVEAMGLPTPAASRPSGHDLLKRFFACDSESWHPAYGKVTPETAREAASAARSGLVLDNTFTAKSFHTLRQYAERGLLHNRSALFWNTYQRFPLQRLLPEDDSWLLPLPEAVKARIEAFRKRAS